jgi:hypothetical protein
MEPCSSEKVAHPRNIPRPPALKMKAVLYAETLITPITLHGVIKQINRIINLRISQLQIFDASYFIHKE